MQNPGELFAVKSMLRSLDWLERFSQIPYSVSGDARDFVLSLAPLCSSPKTPLSDFILRLPLYDLQNEIGAIALPDMHRDNLLEWQGEREQLNLKKENLIVQQDFDAAAACRDRQLAIDDEINEILDDPILVLPVHVCSAVRNLGFAGDFPSAI